MYSFSYKIKGHGSLTRPGRSVIFRLSTTCRQPECSTETSVRAGLDRVSICARLPGHDCNSLQAMKAKLKTYLDAKFASLADQIDFSLRSARRKDPAPRIVSDLPSELPEQESMPPAAQFEAWTRSVDNWLLALTDRVLAVEEQITGMCASIA